MLGLSTTRVVVALFVLSALGGAASCAREVGLDSEMLERDIAATLIPGHPDLVDAVRCPDIVEPAPGDVFRCQAAVAGAAVKVQVQLGGSAEALTSWATTDARFVATGEMATLLATTFDSEIGIATAVDCGAPVQVIEPGIPVTCAATDPTGVVRTFDVTVGEAGELTISIR